MSFHKENPKTTAAIIIAVAVVAVVVFFRPDALEIILPFLQDIFNRPGSVLK